MLNYQKIKYNCTSNGVGIRTALFVSGCTHRCDGCFNAVAWNFNSGETFTLKTIADIVESLKPSYVNGLSVLGGEPLDERNTFVVSKLCNIVKTCKETQGKSVWVYTGYTFEELLNSYNNDIMNILNNTDVLVDGKFEQSLYSPMLRFRGSSNQRVIDVQESLKQGKVILYLE